MSHFQMNAVPQQPRSHGGPCGRPRDEDVADVLESMGCLLPKDLWDAVGKLGAEFAQNVSGIFPPSQLPQPLVRDQYGNVIHRLKPDPYS